MEPLEDHATAPDAPEPWRAIARRVAAGEFTWQDVREGRLVLDDDFLDAVDATATRAAAATKATDDAVDDEQPVVVTEAAITIGGRR